MEVSNWLWVIGELVVLTIFWFGIVERRTRRETQTENDIKALKDTTKDCPKCKETFTELKLKMDLFWDSIRGDLLKIIHEDVAPRRDELGEKFQDKTITLQELYEYDKLLKETIALNHDAGRKYGSAILRGLVAVQMYEMKASHKEVRHLEKECQTR